ncbi:hypothetical protein [Streptomyces sp. NBC_00102]|uniref:hypothetical protein n=1 Tax=Streptomyces sp. NBC_00102 TaxID=2975652 RepID=UPI002259853C|nr:hypothetical protein [Streptomyces sp. NBC_00102]MCX5397980.1 hypothetical protein [Streptomyces sp. NBC_00102]
MNDEKNEAVPPDATPGAPFEATPEATPDAVPDATPEATPDAVPLPEAGSSEGTGASTETGAPAPAAKAGTGRVMRMARYVVPAVVVLGVIAGAGVYTKNTVDSADRTSPTVLWPKGAPKESRAAKGEEKDLGKAALAGRYDSELSKLLLPATDDWQLGMDNGGLSNDSVTTGKEAATAIKQSVHGLAGKARREYEKRVDRMKIQGMAQRSYVSSEMTAVIGVVRMKDTKAVHDLWSADTEFMDGLDIFREGPKIKGYKKALCFRYPKNEDGLDGVMCTAYEDELLITVEAEGTEPMSMSDVAGLVKDELDHIKSPGEYI